MPGIKLDIVTAEKEIYSQEVDMVIAPGVESQLGILPHHTPLMTILQPGELRIKKGGEEVSVVISGGFLEVRPDRVIVLADAAEKVEEVDIARAAFKAGRNRWKGRRPRVRGVAKKLGAGPGSGWPKSPKGLIPLGRKRRCGVRWPVSRWRKQPGGGKKRGLRKTVTRLTICFSGLSQPTR